MVNDPEVGAIVVGSPTPFHAEQIIEAAKLGKHIFCEKVSLVAANQAELNPAAVEVQLCTPLEVAGLGL